MIMNEKEIREKYPPHAVDTQIEFERIMSEMNVEQTHLNHPYLDREREIAAQHATIKMQIQALHQQANALKMERLANEQKRKDINRTFHDLKHEFIKMNPKERFVRREAV